MADIVAGWCGSVKVSAGELGGLLDLSHDLVSAQSIDPTSAILGVLLRARGPELVENFTGLFCISTELESMCPETSAVPENRRVIFS
jgi:hypothetical protein